MNDLWQRAIKAGVEVYYFPHLTDCLDDNYPSWGIDYRGNWWLPEDRGGPFFDDCHTATAGVHTFPEEDWDRVKQELEIILAKLDNGESVFQPSPEND